MYKHLGLTRWPFPVVPEPAFCTFLADRQQLRSDVSDLLAALSRRDTSSIHLFWAWFGAGKTHTLFYLANQAANLTKSEDTNVLRTVYSEFPKTARSFLDLYRAFSVRLDTDILVDAFLEISTCADSEQLRREVMLASPDLLSALQVLATGGPQQQVTAMRWLRGESLPASEFRRVGISQRITSSDEATRILAALVKILGLAARCQGRPGCRLMWLVDEFQRIGRTGSKALEDINTGLHSTFNASPSGFSVFLSFSGRPESKTLPSWFSQEIRDRIGRTKVIILPPMQPGQALTFVSDLLAQFRSADRRQSAPYFPFTEDTCRAIIDDVSKKNELKPRALMHAFNAVLQEADAKIEGQVMGVISPDFAKRVLAECHSLPDGAEPEG